jgi:nitrite reductase/ring-hydroxylating ferredoxin subunit/uncharacterized membrane protein
MAGSLTEGLVKRTAFLDPIADKVQNIVNGLLIKEGAPTPLKQFLNGVWLGHPLHPPLTDVPVGAWVTGAVLDLAGTAGFSDGLRMGADASIALGCAGAVGAAATGFADWGDLYGEPRRAGALHAALNTVALLMNLVSLSKRLGGKRASGMLWSTAALGVASVSAYIGGELLSTHGSGVSHQMWPEPPEDFTAVLDEKDLPEGTPVVAKAGDFPVCLLRRDGEIFVTGKWCTHLGGPLSEGQIDGDVVTCPWHGSQFDLVTGEVVRGPATINARRFETRIQDGKIEIKPA